MKEFWKNLTLKQIILAITTAFSLLVFVILTVVSSSLAGGLEAQNMAERWSKDGGVSQISCFFAQGSGVDENTIKGFEHALDAALQEASITSESPNAGARLWADAYSMSGKLTIVGNSGQMEVHPLKLLTGSFFAGSDLMQDHIVIDEDIAWQLFGSNDVVGQQVTIDGIPHLISGVIRRDSGRMNDNAGNGSSIVYVSFETMSRNRIMRGQAAEINQYEIVMPNPVSEFALGMVRENIGIEENEVEIIENTTRYRLLPLLKILGNFGVRSMNGKAIIYPYWENFARGYEDILALLLIFRILFLLYPAVMFLILVVYLWKHRKWHFKDVKEFLVRGLEKLREKQKRKKDKPIEEEEFDEEEPWL